MHFRLANLVPLVLYKNVIFTIEVLINPSEPFYWSTSSNHIIPKNFEYQNNAFSFLFFFLVKKNCGHFSTNMILVKYLHYYFCFSFYFWLPHLPPCFQCTFCHCNIHEKRSHLCLLMIVLQIYIVILSSNYQKIVKPFHGKSSKSNGSSCPFSLSVKTLTIFIIVFEKGKWSP